MVSFFAQFLTLFRAFLRWWVGELAALVPTRLRQRLTTAKHGLVLLLSEDDANAQLCLEANQELQALGRLDLREESEPQRKVIAILRDRGLLGAFNAGRLGVCVRIPARRASRTIIDLPLAAETNLDEVVFYELDRHTPFRPEHARFSHRVVKRDASGKRLLVELTVVPRPLVDEIVAMAARFNLKPDRIDVAIDGSDLEASGNLLPIDGQTPSSRGSDRLVYALGVLAVLLSIAAIYIPLNAADRAADAVTQEFGDVKKSAAAVAALEKQIEDLRKEEDFLVDRKREAPAVSKLLSETTQILPDDTWLSEWQLTGSVIQLSGFTGSASALVKLLEQSRTFRNTTFLSPVVQDPSTERERFQISVQVVREAGR